ncbi:MAG: hypothetical protein HEQ23_05580 [Tepidisphaera sp.]
MSNSLGYLLTWTCYGTWLHGDARNSVDADHNRVHTPFVMPDADRFDRSAASLKHPVVTLTSETRQLCETVIRKHCEIRGWRLHAVNVRSNHVHVVVTSDLVPESTMDQFKAWCTRKLREDRHFSPRQPIWTEHGSTRWLNTAESLERAVRYVTDQ